MHAPTRRTLRFCRWLLAPLAACLLLPVPALGASIVIQVGDDDGYGLGLADGADLPWMTPVHDLRSDAEKSATNGAQLTDLYAAFYEGLGFECDGEPGGDAAPCSPNGPINSVLFPYDGQIASAVLTIDMGDFQSMIHAPFIVDVNGVPLDFFFDDGFHTTVVRQFALTPAMLVAANLAGEVRLNFNLGRSGDFVAFDYFRLEATPVPEPASILLIATGLGLAASRRRPRGQAPQSPQRAASRMARTSPAVAGRGFG